jgi:SagB-type dehydrogenase family enzyme
MTQEISDNLLEELAQLEPDEQQMVVGLLVRARQRRFARSKLDLLTLLHESLKADTRFHDSYVNPALLQPKVARELFPVDFKSYPDASHYPLARDFLPLDASLEEVLQKRSSGYDYNLAPLDSSRLSTFLHYSCGVKKYVAAYGRPRYPLRFVPSVGGLPDVETYLLLNRAADFEPGLYHYAPVVHALEQLTAVDLRLQLAKSCMQDFVSRAAGVAILTCRLDRISWKYGARSYRYAHADCGVIVENMYLVATALGMSGCAVAGFYEDKIQALLNLDGNSEMVTLLFAFGIPA